MRLASTATTVLLCAALLGGCGGSSTDEFCEKAESADIAGADLDVSAPGEALKETVASFEELAADAPGEIEAELQSLADLLGAFVSAFEDAGIDPSELAAGDAPTEEQSAALEKAMTAVTELDGLEDVEADYEKVATFVDEECGISIE